MSPEIFLLLVLQLKHWYVDFVNQSSAEFQAKQIYGDKIGFYHSAKHGIGTAICVWLVLGFPGFFLAVLMGLLDSVLHYHIDWTKQNYGCKDLTNKVFWAHLGLDQLAHQITYIIILGIVLL